MREGTSMTSVAQYNDAPFDKPANAEEKKSDEDEQKSEMAGIMSFFSK
jgi:hypothetical protein